MTARFLSFARENRLDLDGHLAGQGADALGELSVARLSALVWWWLTRNAQSKADVDKVKTQIWRPPVGFKGKIDERSPWAPQNERGSFAALKAQLGLGADTGKRGGATAASATAGPTSQAPSKRTGRPGHSADALARKMPPTHGPTGAR